MSLHKAMCASFAAYKDGCCPPEGILDTLKATAPLEPGTVVSQCYALGDGPDGCHMMYALAVQDHTHAPAEDGAEGGGEQAAVVGRRRVSAREMDQLAADWSGVRFSQRYEGMPEEEDAAKVFPKYGNIMLQGDSAVAAQERAMGALKEGAASAAMAVLAARDAPTEAMEGYPPPGEKKDLGSDEFLALLQLMVEDEGLDAVEPEFCAALAHAGLLHYTDV